jgi:DNA polymerase (family 10)
MKTNREIARLFNEIADALEFKNENAFKVVAFRKAARIVEELTEDVTRLVHEGHLRSLPGIGSSMVEAIEEYVLFPHRLKSWSGLSNRRRPTPKSRRSWGEEAG